MKLLRSRLNIKLIASLGASVILASSCGIMDEEVSETSGYLGRTYDLTFSLDPSQNILSLNEEDLNMRKGCGFENGTSFKAVKLFQSSSNSEHVYAFLYGTIEGCSLKHGLLHKSSVTGDVEAPRDSYAVTAKHSLVTRAWAEKGTRLKCQIEKGDQLLTTEAPKIVDGKYLYINLLSKQKNCYGGQSFVDLDLIDISAANFENISLSDLKDPKDTGSSITVVSESEHVDAAPEIPASSSVSKNGLSKNMNAFLDTIAYAEGTGSSYNVAYTHATFSSFADHPRKIYCNSYGLCSDASGRYQFLSTTWDGVADALKLKDFTPLNQDLGAEQLIKWRNAHGLVERMTTYSEFQNALYRCAKEWASLPGSPYGQPTKSASVLWDVYQNALKKY